MLENLKEGMLFQPLSDEEKTKRGILGRMYGPIASFKVGTRNGRLYSDELWEKVFENDIVKELLNCGGIPGELNHPEDREETDGTKIAVMMPEAPKKDKQGHLIGYFDIVDTPCGKIVAALAKYGFKFGVSSRGSGDVITDSDGNEAVDPNTYVLNAWDVVLIPACADARMTFQESYNPNANKLKKELFNDINNASDEDREVMLETLNNLDVDYIPKWASNGKKKVLAENIGNDSSAQLQLLKENKELKRQLKDAKSQLSVGYAKDNEMGVKLNEALNNNKSNEEKIISLSNENKTLKEDFKALKDVQRKLTNDSRQTSLLESKLNQATNKLNESVVLNEKLKKELSIAKNNLKVAQSTITNQKESLKEQLKMKDNYIAKLEENNKKDNEVYNSGIKKAKSLVEKYRNLSTNAVNGYINIKAKTLGVSAMQIKSQLGENYSFDDIDRICESLKPSMRQANSLPFRTMGENTKINITSAKNGKPINVDEESIKNIFDYDWN